MFRRLTIALATAIISAAALITLSTPTSARPAPVAPSTPVAVTAGQNVAGTPAHNTPYLDPPTYNGTLGLGQWSNLYAGNCHIMTQHAILGGKPFVRVDRDQNSSCGWAGSRLVYTRAGGLAGSPPSTNTFCNFLSGTYSACTTVASNTGNDLDLWNQPGDGVGLVGSEIVACDTKASHGDNSLPYAYNICGRWNLGLG